MKMKIFNKYVSALALGTAISAVSSCTDTWDEHYAELQDPTTTLTLWDQICANPNLSMFKTIAEKANYYRDETTVVKGYTYADILKGNRVATVWAPENDYFNVPVNGKTLYEEWLEKCTTNGYLVHEQLMSNHMALYRHNLLGDSISKFKTLNSKNAVFDLTNAKFQGIELNEKNIPAINGVLHTLKGVTSYSPNFYQFIKYAEMTPEATAYILKRDTTYFDPDLSIEGQTNAMGMIDYVDSVKATSNTMLYTETYWPENSEERSKWLTPEKGFGYDSGLKVEDSTYVMILPSSAAIQKAKDLLKPFYKYGQVYNDESTFNLETGKYIDSDHFTVVDPDSLSELNMMMDILTPCVFNIHNQKKIGGKVMTMEEFLNGTPAPYYYNTRRDTLRSTSDWDMKSLFANAQLQQMSNGYVYLTDSWNFPASFYKPNIVFELNSLDQTFNSGKVFTAGQFRGRNFNNSQYSNITQRYGKVSKNNFSLIDGGDNLTNFAIQVPLYNNYDESYNPQGEVMSGKYDIQVVFVPMFYSNIVSEGSDTAFVRYDFDKDSLVYNEHAIDSINAGMNKLRFTLYYNQGKTSKSPGNQVLVSDFDTSTFAYFKDKGVKSITKVDTVTIKEDFEFPVSYKNIRNNNSRQRKTFPYLKIENRVSTQKQLQSGYITSFCIDQVILRSKETGEEIVIRP